MSILTKKIALGAAATMISLATIGAAEAGSRSFYKGTHHIQGRHYIHAGFRHHNIVTVKYSPTYCNKYGWHYVGGFKKWGCLY